MIKLGRVARRLREKRGLTQKQTAEMLDITSVYLSNIENDHIEISSAMLKKYRDLWGIDLYVLAWCLRDDVEKLPFGVQKSAKALRDAWVKSLGDILD